MNEQADIVASTPSQVAAYDARKFYIRTYYKRVGNRESFYWSCPDCGGDNITIGPEPSVYGSRLDCHACGHFFIRVTGIHDGEHQRWDPDNPNFPHYLAEARMREPKTPKQTSWYVKLWEWIIGGKV